MLARTDANRQLAWAALFGGWALLSPWSLSGRMKPLATSLLCGAIAVDALVRSGKIVGELEKGHRRELEETKEHMVSVLRRIESKTLALSSCLTQMEGKHGELKGKLLLQETENRRLRKELVAVSQDNRELQEDLLITQRELEEMEQALWAMEEELDARHEGSPDRITPRKIRELQALLGEVRQLNGKRASPYKLHP